MLALLRSLGLHCGSCFHSWMLIRTDQANVLTLVKLQETQQVARGIRGPGREERGKGVFGSGANQVNHGLRLALRSVDGDTESMANRDQAGDSLLNVLQKPSRSNLPREQRCRRRKQASQRRWTP